MLGERRPVRVDVDFSRPRRHSGEGEWVVEQVQPVETVTRETDMACEQFAWVKLRIKDLRWWIQEQIRGIVIRRRGAGAPHSACISRHEKVREEACMPFQYALSTRAGTDFVARVVRSEDFGSIDGTGAFDHTKRKSMLEALHNNADLAPFLPFVRMFYGKDSTYVWYDDEGVPHEILQGEGGEQGDPLMPALCALGVRYAGLA